MIEPQGSRTFSSSLLEQRAEENEGLLPIVYTVDYLILHDLMLHKNPIVHNLLWK